MKIGIMSMQRIINYGSWLQAYGLKSVLESMGHSVEFVDYLAEPSLIPNTSAGKLGSLMQKARNAYKMLSPAYRDYRAQQIRMNQSFAEFHHKFSTEFMPALGVTQTPNLRPELDALVIGSDEVFNCIQPGDTVGYSLPLFGKDHKAKKLISYAASFGSTTLEKLEEFGVQDEIGAHLARFDALSVRDENSVQIVEALCNISPEQNIDPVLLYDFPEADEINVPLRDYIVVYAYAGRIRDDETKAIRDFAQKNGKKIISLGFYQPFCDEYVQATPIEVLAYVKHADYIVTDTFHGTVFSIKYQKKFATLIRESNNQKLEDLLRRFKMERRGVTDLHDMEGILLENIPSEDIKKMQAMYCQEAMDYLSNAL